MSDYTTPEDLQDDLYDSKYDPDKRFEPDNGKYAVEINFAELKQRGPVGQNNVILGQRYSFGLNVLSGPTQEGGLNPAGKTFFTDVFVPGGDWNDPVYEARNGRSVQEVETGDKQSFRSVLDSFGWSRELGTLYRTDANVFKGAKAVVKVSWKVPKGKPVGTEPRMYVNFDVEASKQLRENTD